MKKTNTIKWNYLINSSVVIVGVLAIAIIFNLLVSLFVAKVPVKIDLTSSKQYEISDYTYDFLKTYTIPTTIYIIASEAEENLAVKEILTKYAKANKYINIQNINPTENPTFGAKYAKQGQTISKQSIIIDAGDRFKAYNIMDLFNVDASSSRATSIKAEQRITSGLKYVASDEDHTVYFIQGHGEGNLAGLRDKLNLENYEVKDWNITTEEIPLDAKLIVVGSPKTDFSLSDIAKLDQFFANAGRAQFFMEATSLNMPNLYQHIKEWGIVVNDDLVVEQGKQNVASLMGTPIILPVLEENEINTAMIQQKRNIAYLPYSKTLNLLYESNSGSDVQKILTTTSQAYTKTDILNLTSDEKTEQDKVGTFVIAATSTRQGASPEKDAMIFVSGTNLLMDYNVEEVSNGLSLGNYDFMMNVFNFLQGSKDDYSIPAKSLISDTVSMNMLDALIVSGLVIVVIPIGMLISGIVVWARRRNL